MTIKDTLHMPKTEFNMKASLPNREPIWQKEWEENNIYQNVMKKNEGRELFILHDGPPYANGNIHMGHSLNKVLKDIIIRSKNMNGYKAPIIFGWDTHGLPIENAMLKKMKKKANDLNDLELRKECATYALGQVNNQKEQFFTLGLMADRDENYITLDKEFESEQILVFNSMVEKGLIYKGQRPVFWSWSSKTALAEAEIEYEDKKSPAIYVAMELNSEEFIGCEIVIWTTTPWTIPANKGVAVGSDFDYSIVNINDRKLIVATDLVESFVEEIGVEEYDIKKNIKGKDLNGVTVLHPITNQKNKIMIGHHVTVENGTGCVHIAPAHGEDDFLIGKQYGLDINSIVDEGGVLNDYAGEFSGLFYETANKEIGMKLEEKGKLLKLKFITHSFPHDWRTKKPVFFRTTKQWFANIEPIKKELLEAINTTNYITDWGRVRLYNMIEGRTEWCISRQRKWGVPIPIFYTEDKEPIIDKDLILHVGKLFKEHGSNIWYEKSAEDLLPKGYTNPASPNGIFTKETDIMDVWFDSGSSHSAVITKKYGVKQADLYLEGSDQYRGWFNSSLITSIAQKEVAPYKTLISHGFVLDGKGNKMSKSIGNTMAPDQITKQKGADILRLWVSSVDYQSDVRISDEIVGQVSELYRKYRNTLRFMLGNISDFDHTMMINFDDLIEVDKYILIKLDIINKEVKDAYENYDFKKITDIINNFITKELSSFYLDFIKDIVYITEKSDVRRRQVQTVLYTCLEYLIKLMTPIIPHTTYEAYKLLTGKDVFLTDFNDSEIYVNDQIESKFDMFLEVRDDINKVLEEKRQEKMIGKSLNAKVVINPTIEVNELLKTINDLDILLIVSKFEIDETLKVGQKLNSGLIEVSLYDETECQRCRKFFIKENTKKIQLEEELTVCKSCFEIINKI